MKSTIFIIALTLVLAMVVPSRAEGADRDILSEDEFESLKNISYLGYTNQPRGIRNNNPGNLEQNPNNNWKGKRDPSLNKDGRFEQFTAFVWGVRAMIKLIRDTYITKQEYNTIELIIHKYAPARENNVTAYINQVVKKSGIPRSQILSTDYGVIKPIVQAMADHENGTQNTITDQMFLAAWKLA